MLWKYSLFDMFFRACVCSATLLLLLMRLPVVHSLTIDVEPSELFVSRHNKATFTCSVDVELLPTQPLMWMKGEQIISVGEFVQGNTGTSLFIATLDPEKRQYNITFSNVQPEDQGTYRCGVEFNNTRTAWSSGSNLIVLLFIVEQPNDIGVYEGNSVVLPCAANITSADHTLIWSKEDLVFIRDGVVMDVGNLPARGAFLGQPSDGENSIIISNVTAWDTGTYRCGVETGDGDTEWSRTVWLTVLESVEREPVDASVPEHQSYELRCEVTQFQPRQSLVWQKDGRTISWNEHIHESYDSYRAVIVSDSAQNNNYDIIFTYVLLKDSGLYKCGVEFPNHVYFWFSAIQLSITRLPQSTESSRATSERTVSPVLSWPTATTPANDRKNSNGTSMTTHSPYTTVIPGDYDPQSEVKVIKLWVILVATVVGILAILAVVVIVIIMMMRANQQRQQKKIDEYSPQESSLDRLHSRLKRAGYENRFYVVEAEKNGQTCSEDDIDAQSRHSGDGEENPSEQVTEIRKNVQTEKGMSSNTTTVTAVDETTEAQSTQDSDESDKFRTVDNIPVDVIAANGINPQNDSNSFQENTAFEDETAFVVP
ncbi:polymeric immunoglobulin receptor-like [Ptychodera flava]|uniref:polymeric immunoglobulin receptor-like n=1 Tax=Ptychodera flava TaxID=63121 RepID=UPI00396A5FD9